MLQLVTANPRDRRWFHLGADRFRAWTARYASELEEQLPEDPLYPCPLCLALFYESAIDAGALTAEHVPPKSTGGKAILLTCKPCNNDQGSKFDHHALKHERWIDNATGRRIWPFEGLHRIGNETRRVEIWHGPSSLLIGYEPKQNNKFTHDAYLEAFEDPSNTTQHVTIKGGFIRGRAELSFLRTAYLVTFAVFGWQDVFRPTSAAIRDRLATATIDGLPDVLLITPDAAADRREVFLVSDNSVLDGVVIMSFGRITVLLPGPRDHRSLDQVATAYQDWVDSGRPAVEGYPLPWPTEPEHRFDPERDQARR